MSVVIWSVCVVHHIYIYTYDSTYDVSGWGACHFVSFHFHLRTKHCLVNTESVYLGGFISSTLCVGPTRVTGLSCACHHACSFRWQEADAHGGTHAGLQRLGLTVLAQRRILVWLVDPESVTHPALDIAAHSHVLPWSPLPLPNPGYRM